MKESELAAIVSRVVGDWTRGLSVDKQVAQLAKPAQLSLELGLAASQLLRAAGHEPQALQELVLRRPYVHLAAAFDPTELPETPTGFCPVPDSRGTLAGRAAALAAHGVLILETVSYGSENAGALFVNLVALPGVGVVAERSTKSMRGHTDAVSFPLNGDDFEGDFRIAPSPDVVTLVGLRNPDGIATRLMKLEDILGRLSESDIDELRKPQYSFRSQRTFVEGMKRILGGELVVTDEPILKDTRLGPSIRYSHSSVVPTEAGGPAELAANNLEVACGAVATDVVIRPGDVCIVNNRLSLHGRAKVGEGAGGESRWLLRTYGLDTRELPEHKRYGSSAARHVLFP